MNFFEQQDRARRNSFRLVALLALAVICLILMTTALIAGILYSLQSGTPIHIQITDLGFDSAANIFNWPLLGSVALAITALVCVASLYKLMQLAGGGQCVAEALGGRLINLNTRDADEKKMLNVVEEMAIASGTPVPPVYLLDEAGINAFAAGHKPQNAVIGVTRGCINSLSREELQGVVAHEFSHIFHGDMRLNLRLVSILHGILAIGLLGNLLMRSQFYRSSSNRRSSGKNSIAILGAGLALMAIGYSGTFFGNLIKAAVSRQREFLADASAVQFTRDPNGIAGALKKIASHTGGSQIEASNAAQFSHMYFSQGFTSTFNFLMATHPPLVERIRRVMPTWDGKFTARLKNNGIPNNLQTAKSSLGEMAFVGASAITNNNKNQQPTSALDCIGKPCDEQLAAAKKILSSIPEPIIEAAHNSFSARAIIYSLLIDPDNDIKIKQFALLKSRSHPQTFKEFQRINHAINTMPVELRLPLIDLTMPALKALSEPQYAVFKRCLVQLIQADNKVSLFEWSLYRILINNLENSGNLGPNNKRLSNCSRACEILFATLARAGGTDKAQQLIAFNRATTAIGQPKLQFEKEEHKLASLDWALKRLRMLKPLQKPLLLKAMAACISADGTVTACEAELFRAIADNLDCPIPPLLAGQKLF